jgi:hypothetical protein
MMATELGKERFIKLERGYFISFLQLRCLLSNNVCYEFDIISAKRLRSQLIWSWICANVMHFGFYGDGSVLALSVGWRRVSRVLATEALLVESMYQ